MAGDGLMAVRGAEPWIGVGEKAPEMDAVERWPGPSQLVKGSTSLDSGLHKPSNPVWRIQLPLLESQTGVLPRDTHPRMGGMLVLGKGVDGGVTGLRAS